MTGSRPMSCARRSLKSFTRRPGVAASVLRVPDVRLTRLTEIVERARRRFSVVNFPLIADADTDIGMP